MHLAFFDDHPIILESLKSIMDREKEIVEHHYFTHSTDLLNHLKQSKVDIVIVDLLTDKELGLTLIQTIQKYFPSIKIIVYSMNSSQYVIDSIIGLGISKFINKTTHTNELVAAIKQIYEENDTIEAVSKVKCKLTTKEREIISYIVEGKSSTIIADLTGNSVNTINNQKNNLLKKFKCDSTNELIKKVISLGFVRI